MNYMTTKEASQKWHVSDRRIRIMLRENRITGAIKVGRNWLIPSDSKKPRDLRVKSKSNFDGLDFDFSLIDRLIQKLSKKDKEKQISYD